MAIKEFTVPVKGIGSPDYSKEISHAGVEIDPRIITDLSDAVKDALSKILSRVTEFSSDSGTATGGSQTTCVDTAKNWETDMWKGAVIEIYSVADDIYYLRTVSGNTATTITHAALPATKAVASGDPYALRLTIGLVDLDKVGGTALTGRDISGKGLGFSGAVYENEDTATADATRRFETSSKKLRDVIIQVVTQNQLFGNATNQRYLVAAGEVIGFTQVDISTLYFKNAATGQNGTVNILGVED